MAGRGVEIRRRRSGPLQAERLRDENRHLATGHETVGAVDRRREGRMCAAPSGDAGCQQGLDVLISLVVGGNVIERGRAGCRAT